MCLGEQHNSVSLQRALQKWPTGSRHSLQFGWYVLFSHPVSAFAGAAVMMFLMLRRARNIPSCPSGASPAIKALARGPQITSPSVKKITHAALAQTDGSTARKYGDKAHIHTPGEMILNLGSRLPCPTTQAGVVLGISYQLR